MRLRKRYFPLSVIPASLIFLGIIITTIIYLNGMPSRIPRFIPVIFFDEVLPQRQYLTVTMDNDPRRSACALEFTSMYMREIMQKCDTIHGIHYVFGPDATYGQFVKILNLLNANRAEYYKVTTGEIWFYQKPGEVFTSNIEMYNM